MEKSERSFVVEEAEILEIGAALSEGRLTSVELVQLYLERIEQYDHQLNAIVAVNPDALTVAAELDAKRGEAKRGPLYGVPILLKDNIETSDQMPTTAGARVLANNYATEDSFVAKQLREAGAIILGKVNLSEFANFISDKLPNGFSGVRGQTKNPYQPGVFDTGGSSSGTGASIAASFAAAGVGSETSGSILSPASSNSLVGIKPTLGLVSRTGMIPLAHSQDTAGPMARTVTDAAILLTAIAGFDEEDQVTAPSTRHVHNYTDFLKKDGLKGARIGVDRTTMEWLTDAEKDIMERAIDVMKEQGAIIVDPINVPLPTHKSIVLHHEFKHDLNAYLSKLSSDVPVRTLAEVIAWNKEHPEAIPYGQSILEAAQEMSDDPNDPAYLADRQEDLVQSGEKGIDQMFKTFEIDAILFPKNYGAAAPAKAGYPSITVPGGYTPEGEPVGVTFSAMAYSEPKLIEIAYSYEQATHNRVAPVLDFIEKGDN
ncbi:amidase family protein [Bacillus suaedae]|uniref:Amidase n=1 Tax=Halalkalibacter suaedae TaxID=2822140 RepID=A0A940WXL6_9BACI|nr:amidase family protein [Bacillus suaedae]MBP3950160.1 amidase [Bacillus suaedae]